MHLSSLCFKLSKFGIIGHATLLILIKGFCKALQNTLSSYTSMHCKHACMRTMQRHLYASKPLSRLEVQMYVYKW